jgi:hypothetical protein
MEQNAHIQALYKVDTDSAVKQPTKKTSILLSFMLRHREA